MKESELMKFDWVMFDEENYEPYEISRVYMQVEHFNCGAVYGKDSFGHGIYIAHCEEDSNYNSRKYGKVIPIPLTKEILEKNGFKKKDYGDYILIDGDAFVGWKPTHGNVRILVSNEYMTIVKDILIPCEHIHQLQHALRLCGLNELADNIKI